MNELEERDKSKDKYYGEALSALEKEVIRLRGKSGILPGIGPKLLPEKPLLLQEKEDEDDDKPGKGWVSWLRSKIIGAEGREEASKSVVPEPDAKAREPKATLSENQPSPSIIERVRQRTLPREIRPKAPDEPVGGSGTQPSSESRPSL